MTRAKDFNRLKAFKYYTMGLSIAEIAKLLDLSPRSIERFSSIDNWRSKLAAPPLTKQIITLRERGLKLREIADTLNVSIPTVDRHLKAWRQNLAAK